MKARAAAIQGAEELLSNEPYQFTTEPQSLQARRSNDDTSQVI